MGRRSDSQSLVRRADPSPGLTDALADLLAEERGKVRVLERELDEAHRWMLWLACRVQFLETKGD